jgi:hypothetical protein
MPQEIQQMMAKALGVRLTNLSLQRGGRGRSKFLVCNSKFFVLWHGNCLHPT